MPNWRGAPAFPPAELGHFKGGGFDADTARKVAGPLNLGAEALIELGQKVVVSGSRSKSSGLAIFNTPYEDVTVNSYLVFDPKLQTGGGLRHRLDGCRNAGIRQGTPS